MWSAAKVGCPVHVQGSGTRQAHLSHATTLVTWGYRQGTPSSYITGLEFSKSQSPQEEQRQTMTCLPQAPGFQRSGKRPPAKSEGGGSEGAYNELVGPQVRISAPLQQKQGITSSSHTELTAFCTTQEGAGPWPHAPLCTGMPLIGWEAAPG